MAIRPIGPGSPITSANAHRVYRLAAGAATTATGAPNRIPSGSPSTAPANSGAANNNQANGSAQANVVSELVTTNAGGVITTLTTYQDGHETARTSFPRFTSTGALQDNGNERGQLINILV